MILPLTSEQAKLFNKLKAAYKACEKAGIYFVNGYGTLEAYDKAIVSEYGDSSSLNKRAANVFEANDFHTLHNFKIPNEWCDDSHLIQLTAKGLKLKEDDYED